MMTVDNRSVRGFGRLRTALLPVLLVLVAVFHVAARGSSVGGSWQGWLVVVLAAGVLWQGLARELPIQNVLAVACILALTGSATLFLAALPEIHARVAQTGRLGLPVTTFAFAGFVWNGIVLGSRGVARRLLLPQWESAPYRGLGTLLLALVLGVILMELAAPLWRAAGVEGVAAYPFRLGWVPVVGLGFTLVAVVPFLLLKRPTAPVVAGALGTGEAVLFWTVLTAMAVVDGNMGAGRRVCVVAAVLVVGFAWVKTVWARAAVAKASAGPSMIV